MNSARARQQHTRLIQALKQFRGRWRTEYLTSLLQRHERLKKRGSSPTPVQSGQLILLHSLTLPRYAWPLAKIIETYADSENVIRSVKVLCRGEEYVRPIEHVIPLELDGEETANGDEADDEVSHDENDDDKRSDDEAESSPPSPLPTQPLHGPVSRPAENKSQVDSPLPSHTSPLPPVAPTPGDPAPTSADSPATRSDYDVNPPTRAQRQTARLQRQRMKELVTQGLL